MHLPTKACQRKDLAIELPSGFKWTKNKTLHYLCFAKTNKLN